MIQEVFWLKTERLSLTFLLSDPLNEPLHPFNNVNDSFPYPFLILSSWNPYPSIFLHPGGGGGGVAPLLVHVRSCIHGYPGFHPIIQAKLWIFAADISWTTAMRQPRQVDFNHIYWLFWLLLTCKTKNIVN